MLKFLELKIETNSRSHEASEQVAFLSNLLEHLIQFDARSFTIAQNLPCWMTGLKASLVPNPNLILIPQ